MAGIRELGFPKTSSSASSLREQAARATLRNVRMQGHTCVELREDGKRFIFFCTLCLAPCYSDSVLFDHLKGNLHTERFAVAKLTLLGPNPWPFNDGVLFFHDSVHHDTHNAGLNADQIRLLGTHIDDDNNNVAIVGSNRHVGLDENLNGNGGNCDTVVIPGVMLKEEVSDLEVRFVGFGKIGLRFHEKDEVSNVVSKIWCEWLGKKHSDDGVGVTSGVPEHDFAVVTFTYGYYLGKEGLIDDVRSLLPSSSPGEIENVEHPRKKIKKSFSDPEDISESLSTQHDSCEEDSVVSNSPTSRLLLDDQLLHTRFISSKSIRRELRRQQRVAAERMCDICQHKMLPGKDVATLLNMKTGRLACSRRNVNGAFHVFHTSCLIHWILLGEYELFTNQSVSPRVTRKPRRKSKDNEIQKEGEISATRTEICSVFCPECQGTGINFDGDKLEKPMVPLAEMFKYKIKVSDAHRAWMKSPEVLQNCSTGFDFPSQSEETVQEKVSPLKFLRFYGVDV